MADRAVRRVLFSSSVLIALVLSLSCGGGGGGEGPPKGAGTAAVNVTLSDPVTCSAPQGSYSHIYLTIADVQANTSATASATDTGWIDLTPNLSSAPVQVDLIGTSAIQCSLPALVSGTQIIPANFQSFRVILLGNSSASKIQNNQCGAAANCVVLSPSNSVQPITLSSESQSGITIPPAQIASGSFNVAVNETKTLNLSVNSCASVVTQTNGQLRLKPVIFAGQIGSSSTTISGRVVDGANLGTIPGGRVVVALENVDKSGVDRIVQATVPDGTGAFSFCSLPSGTYDVAAIATDGLNISYGATIATGVPAGTNVGNIPIYQQPGPNQTAANLKGLITTAGASAGVSADLSVSLVQTGTLANGNTVTFTVPQVAPPAPTASLPTEANASCPANTDCVSYTLSAAVANPYVGAFATNGITYAQATGSAPYLVDALAFVAGSGSVVNCTPSEQKSGAIDVSTGAGTTVKIADLTFTGCQ